MTFHYSKRFLRQHAAAPAEVRKAFEKQSRHLLNNLNHPSLRAKKYTESINLWQARVNRDWRFYFTIEADAYHLHEITAHPK